MTKDHVIMLVIGALVYYGYLRFRGVITGNPLHPAYIARG
jgi:hypothetical protein